MRERKLIGIVILCLGAFVLLRGASFTSRHDVLQVGDLKVQTTERQWVPPWVGGIAVAVGLVLLVTGMPRRV